MNCYILLIKRRVTGIKDPKKNGSLRVIVTLLSFIESLMDAKGRELFSLRKMVII
jgi:hypothetical protein